MKNLIPVLLLSLLLSGAVLGQSKKEQKAKESAEAYQKTKALIESREYYFQGDWATPLGGRRINLTTNANFLKVKTDSADIYLPYFGSVTSPSVAVSGQGGIVFLGLMDDYEVKYNEKKQKITVTFDTRDQNDRYEFILLVSKSGNAILNVNSNYRSGIKYDGKIYKPVPKD